VRDHVGDGLRVAAAVAHEGTAGGYVPAGALVWGRRPQRDVALAVGALVPGDFGVLEVGLGGGLAGVWGGRGGLLVYIGVGVVVFTPLGMSLGETVRRRRWSDEWPFITPPLRPDSCTNGA
jgi:hypothetical protein